MKRLLYLSGRDLFLLAAGLFAACMVGLSLLGGLLAWSPVPFWDMWDGYLDFFLRLQDGENRIWWLQHNDHRILLTKILFWMDLKWFGGTGAFLIALNYILVSCAALLFCKIFRQLAGTVRATAAEWSAMLFLTGWLFLWTQQENLTWAFQSQFFLVQLLPLCAFYWLYQSTDEAEPGRQFVCAAVFGLSCIGTMANGIFVLPMMVAYAIVARLGRLKIACLAGLSVIGLTAFFYQYSMLVSHMPIHQVMLEYPLQMLTYTLHYLGSPFYFLAGGTPWARHVALAAGLLMMTCSIYQAYRLLVSPQRSPALALTFFIAYIVLSGFITAAGRMFIGADQAFAGRYSTPAVMAWAALGVQYFPVLRAKEQCWQRLSVAALCLLGTFMLVLQSHALKPQIDAVFNKNVAALALAMGVHDEAQIAHIYPSAPRALDLAAKAMARELSVFGNYPLRQVRAGIGQPWPMAGVRCEGTLTEAVPINGEARYLRVHGELHIPGSKENSSFLRFVAGGKVIGYAMMGGNVESGDMPASKAGFTGYVAADALKGELFLQGENPACFLRAHLSQPLFSLTAMAPAPQFASVGRHSVLVGNQWQGFDYEKSHIDGMQVYGSLIHGDGDTGAISLRLKRGDRLFYRSGPRSGRQIIEIEGQPELRMIMPVMTQWTRMDFNTAVVPLGDLVVKFIDSGSGWGEWSAIAVNAE